MRRVAYLLLVTAMGMVATVLAFTSTAGAVTDLTWTGASSSHLWSNRLDWSGTPGSPLVASMLAFPDLGSGCGQNPSTIGCYFSEDDSGPATADELTLDDDRQYWVWPAFASDTLTLDGNGAVPNVGLELSQRKQARLTTCRRSACPSSWAPHRPRGDGRQ